MKRLLALVATAMLTTFAFAENTVHLGAFFPIHPATLGQDGQTADLSSSGFGVNVDYTHVCDGGFTFKFDLGLARTSTKDLWDESLSGVNFLGDVGFGWSFIHDEKMTLTLTGNIGLSGCSYKLEEKYNTTSYSSTVVADRERKLTLTEFYFGPEIAFTYRFNKHFGAFADVGLFYATGSADYKDKAYALGNKLYERSESLDISGLLFVPKAGMSFTF
jgi:hypothetical protein